MSRIARVVAPGYPHHVTQRGVRRMQVFFTDDDYLMYLNLMSKCCDKYGLDIWAYCLMPNHAHMIAIPKSKDSLYKGIAQAHRQYAMYKNEQNDWSGHLWQERFSSFLMDPPHMVAAARYIEQNPARAGLVKNPADWRWSSAAAHISGVDDTLVKAAPLIKIVQRKWEDFIAVTDHDEALASAESFKSHEKSGRPLGSDSFVESIEQTTGFPAKKRKPGPKKNILNEILK